MKNLLNIENLTYSIPYSREIYHNVNLKINEGEIVGLLGVNGSGKTTLIDIILGQRNNYSGTINVIDETPTNQNRNNLEDIFFISQDITLPGKFTILEFCQFNQVLYQRYDKIIENELLNLFDLKPDTKIGSLSTGQQRKVQIICALASLPKLLIVDEITAVLDPETRSKFFYAIKKSQQKNKLTVIIATNIAEDLIDCTERIYFIQNQSISEHKPTEIEKLFNIIKK